jgi:hypothetical protein
MAGNNMLTATIGVAVLAVAGVVVAAPTALAAVPCKPGTSQVVSPVAIQVCSLTGTWVLTPCPKSKPVAHAFTPTKARCLPVS